jgi:non-ribosomal peptide synthetase component F/acyl carrier protein
MGRIDRQVKIRGYRIELEEIEEILKKCEGVQQTAVVVLENKLRDKRIIAYCTGTYNEQQIKQTLGSQLPNYMMPSAYVHLPHLPLTPNGKIDRKALPIPQYGLDDLDYDPPRDPVEMEVVKIFESFLDLERVSINANFFSLGGHSLLAARIITQINREFHINLPLKTLFEKPTVSLIAKEIEIALRGYKAPSISKAPEANTFELSYSQQRFWFLEQQTKNTAAYSIPVLIEFIGEVDFAILQRSVKTIIDRHEILRTVFKEGAEGPEQFFLSDIKPLIRYEELSNEKDVKNLITEESKKSFELSSGPLFRFLLIRTQKNRHLFFLNFHHIIFDGYSINIFIEELKALYIAYKQKQPTTLQDLNIQYVDYVRWQNNSLEKVTEENQAAWWVEKLYDAPSILNLSTDKQRPPIQTYNGALHEFPLLNHADLATLKKLSQKHELTLFMILLAAFHVFLYRYTGQNDIIIGIPVSGRNHADLNSLIGCFINTIAFRTTSSSKDAFLDFLTWIRDEAFETFKHQDVPFEKVVEKLKMERLLSHSLLFQVMFNMLPKLEDNYIQDIQMNLRSIDRGMAHFDLSLSVQETPEGLLGIFEYNTDLFFNETIKCMAKHFKRLLQEIIKNPEQSIGKLPLLAEDEVQKQVVKWNKQDILYPKDESIIQLIEKWAKCSPDSIAIICKEKSYSYYEINAQANKIANALLSFGIQSEGRVVVCLERSAEFISTILGILKAGGVYVPIDPLAPKERVESILQDLQPFRILTHSTFQNRFSGFSTLCIDELTTSISHNPLVQISAKQLAYIIYTSGSTGNPKGVEIEHRSINDRVLWKNAAYPLSPSDVMLHTYSFIFDGAIINYFWPLCVGASLVIASEEEQLDPAALVQLIRKYKVTTMDLLPSLLQGLLDE